MLIAAGALIQFAKFMQITMLIILPLLVLSVAWTIVTHYRQKKNKKIIPLYKPDPVLRLINATPELINFGEVEGDYVHFDQSALVKEYKSKLVYSHARYSALQKDHDQLQDKCNSLLAILESDSVNNKKLIMENQEQELTPVVNTAAAMVYTVPESVNNEEDACLRDMLEEKKAQIGFLQLQLEQRIRNFHQAEKQLAEINAQFAACRDDFETTCTTLADLRVSISKKEALISDLRERLAEKESLFSEREGNVLWLENTLRETREQNEMLNAMLADNKDLVQSQQTVIETEQARSLQLEQKLDRNRQIMKRLFSELAMCMEPDHNESPVIELKAAFVKDQQDALVETIG